MAKFIKWMEASPDELLEDVRSAVWIPLAAGHALCAAGRETRNRTRSEQVRFGGPRRRGPGARLLTYVRLARALSLEEILVSPLNLRDGLIKEMASRDEWTENFTHQIIRSAVDFGRRFGFDEPHGRHVAELSRMLFRALQPEHQLGYRYEVTLYVAAAARRGLRGQRTQSPQAQHVLDRQRRSVRAESEGRAAGGADGPLPSPLVAQADPRGLCDLGLGKPHQCGQDGRHAATGRLRWIAPTVSG